MLYIFEGESSDKKIMKWRRNSVLCMFLLHFSLLARATNAVDTITTTHFISGNQVLTSPKEVFEMGFFNIDSSNNWYVGLWYKGISPREILWVLNRRNPVTNVPGTLKIGNEGNLVLIDSSETVIWSTNFTNNGNAIAQLLDTGNLILRENSSEIRWQSFDYPTDTLLPEMKLGIDLKTGFSRILSSWKSANDPSPGDYSLKLDAKGMPQYFIWQKGVKLHRSGPWNGLSFSGIPEMRYTKEFEFSFVSNSKEIYYSYKSGSQSPISRLVMNHTGLLQRYTWTTDDKYWNFFWFAPRDQCDIYAECGPFGVCDTNNSPICQCIQGFEPIHPRRWNLRGGRNGCKRKTNLTCSHSDDEFLELSWMKLPDTSNVFVDYTMNLEECKATCLKNCSCTGYANARIDDGGSGCIYWLDDLIDFRRHSGKGQSVYVRLAKSDLPLSSRIDDSKRRSTILIVIAVIVLSLLLLGLAFFLWKRNSGTNEVSASPEEGGCRQKIAEDGNNELLLFDLDTIKAATNNFSFENKLGQGGFGGVYKGQLADGKEIAVKRLSSRSGQGRDEFKNEVTLLTKLQHRNLVRVLGCCVDDGEKILIYEYMQNRSLNSIIFDDNKREILKWTQRFQIISGIARGILYLHEDSRLRIIHRDIKASNILLDENMDPKISDFGTARLFGGDETEANTKRIIGTYGYMSPEYAMNGRFSVKSDVFSFGVLVLEIISGNKNRCVQYPHHKYNLLEHVWKLWNKNKALEFMDASMGSEISISEILRCIQVGLLCVQERAEDRPHMATIVLMLSNGNAVLPEPRQPGFTMERNPNNTDSSSVNEVTITTIECR